MDDAIIRDKVEWKNLIYKSYIKCNKSDTEFLKLRSAIKEVSDIIMTRKNYYHDNLIKMLTFTFQYETFFFMLTSQRCKREVFET